MKESEFKKKWEEWYGDILSGHQWSELEHNGKKLIYVCGSFTMGTDRDWFTSNFIQVIGYSDLKELLGEEEQKEIKELFKCQQGGETLSFWAEPFS
jgi:hypothetical protein